MTEMMKRKESKENLFGFRYFFEDLYQEAFFRNITELTMLAPDGKKSKLTMTDLQNVINQLPEPSDLERKRREDMKAAMKEYEKKNKKKEIAARDSANGIHIEGKTGR
ncbi:hypothetical protein [Parabacteroides goldsteinii]|nr:hypothetical protein [Parabacteroides goldsteinii]